MMSKEVTVEELLALVARMKAREPHAQCGEGSGPLAPLAAALNELSDDLSSAPANDDNIFGPRTLIAHALNVMMACDVHGIIQFINYVRPPHTFASVIGTSIFDWSAPETVDNVRSAFQKVLTTGKPSGYEARIMGVIGREWFSGQVGPIKVDQRIVGFSVIVTDITQLKHTQLRLERSNQELESFAYVASHDLQEPLRKIQTFGERLKVTCAPLLPPEGREYIERMQLAATRMRRLIDDLLSFSRISSKSRPFISVDLGNIAREVMGDLELAIEKAGAQVSVGELPVIEADPSQMRQLLQNLMGNALKFRRPDTPLHLSVRATVNASAQNCELLVEDNGIGFEEKYTDRIFNVFQRLHGRGQYEGTGIGLAICRKIAERHGGSICARSTPDQGATFTVTLPLKQPTLR